MTLNEILAELAEVRIELLEYVGEEYKFRGEHQKYYLNQCREQFDRIEGGIRELADHIPDAGKMMEGE